MKVGPVPLLLTAACAGGPPPSQPPSTVAAPSAAARVADATTESPLGPTADLDAGSDAADDSASATSVALVDGATDGRADRPFVHFPPNCGGMETTSHLVRGRVRAAGTESVRARGANNSVDFVEIDILEYVWGSADDVLPQFRKSFYAVVTTDFCDDHHNCGFGGRGVPTVLKPHKGEEMVFVVSLPTKDGGGTEGGAIPPRLLARYGPKQGFLTGFCPIESIPDLVALKKHQVRGARD